MCGCRMKKILNVLVKNTHRLFQIIPSEFPTKLRLTFCCWHVCYLCQGYHGDTSKTFLCGNVNDAMKRLVKVNLAFTCRKEKNSILFVLQIVLDNETKKWWIEVRSLKQFDSKCFTFSRTRLE